MKEPFTKFIKDNLNFDFVLITCGLPGTWKTETSEEVVKTKGYPLLRSDIIRLEVLKNEDVFDEKVAGNMDKRMLVYEELFRQAEEALKKNKGVALDATFVTQALRKRAAAIAVKHKLPLVILQTDCSQEVAIGRILKRTKERYESNALTEKAYLDNKKKFEKVDLKDLKESFPRLSITHLVVDTSDDPPEAWYITGIEKK